MLDILPMLQAASAGADKGYGLIGAGLAAGLAVVGVVLAFSLGLGAGADATDWARASASARSVARRPRVSPASPMPRRASRPR